MDRSNSVHHQRAASDPARGADADSPARIPARGWLDIAKRVGSQVGSDHISIVSAGVAFFAFLALFPAIAAAFSLYGLVTPPHQVEGQMAVIAGYLPQQAAEIITSQLERLAAQPKEAMGWGAALSILLGLWSANKGTKALFEGVSIAYNEDGQRNFFMKTGVSLLFTLGGIVAALIAVALLVVFPAVAENFGLPGPLETIISWARWPLLALVLLVGFALVYRYAPVREDPKLRWVSVGAVLGLVLWLAGSWALSYYVANFNDYNESYGTVAAVVILMLWLWLSSFVVLLGAEVNSETELQTARDSTTGPDRPMGERGAFHADHVARGS